METDTALVRSEADTDLRSEALRRLKAKRDFQAHLVGYVLVNASLWAIWGVFFAVSGAWFPWPLFGVLGWGVGLAFHAWDVYGRRPFTEEDIRREEARLDHSDLAT
jgi:uncharacterized membrane protein